MATITLNGPSYYLSGTNVDNLNSRVVGYESTYNRVARYSFTSPSSGASHVDLSFTGMTLGGGTQTPLRFYIGTDSTDHANAGAGSSYTGQMSYSNSTWSGSADIILQPSTTYYLWVFPSTTTYGYWYWVYATATMTSNGGLKTVISGSNGTLGSSNTLTLNRYSNDFTHKITATCGTSTITISSSTQDKEVSWTPPISWASQNVNALQVNVTVYCYTYNDSTSVGDPTSVTLTMSIPSSVVPSASVSSISDTSGYYSKYGGYIQNKSIVTVTASGSGVHGSTITRYDITCGSQTANNTKSGTFTLTGYGTITVTVKVTDTRGRTATASTNISVLPYSSPAVQIVDVYRSNASGTAARDGSYATVKYNATVTSLNNKNTASYKLWYRVRGSSSWSSVELSDKANVYSISNATKVFSADTSSSYEVCVSVNDAFGYTESAYVVVSSTGAFLTINRSTNSISFGTTETQSNTMLFAIDTQFDGDMVLTSYQYGTSLPAAGTKGRIFFKKV